MEHLQIKTRDTTQDFYQTVPTQHEKERQNSCDKA